MGLGRCWGWCEGRRFCGADRAGKPARDNGPPAASAGAAQTESLAPAPASLQPTRSDAPFSG
jgi:hypothetical protein